MSLFERINPGLLITSLLICSLSVLILFSFDSTMAKQQFIYVILGFLIFYAMSFIDYSLPLLFSKYLYILNLLFFVLTFVLGREIRGSVRWLSFPFINFQPSEFSKVVLIVVLAAFLSGRIKERLKTGVFLKSLLIFFPFWVFVFIQPDLGTSIILGLIYITMILCLKPNIYYFILGFVLVGLILNPVWTGLKDYQKERIETFINPALDPKGSGYNVLQSTIAVGSGMFYGKGFGFGTQSRLRFLPEYYTDFIFASFSEEWGFVGSFVLLLLFFVLLYTIIGCFGRAERLAGRLMCAGVFSFIFFHVLINVGMNLGIMPVTGIPLPLMSYGGSSMVSTFFGLGLVNSVWLKSKRL